MIGQSDVLMHTLQWQKQCREKKRNSLRDLNKLPLREQTPPFYIRYKDVY